MNMRFLVLSGICLSLLACGGGDEVIKNKKNEVVVHELSDPSKLNPLTTSDANAGVIMGNIFESLVSSDITTLERFPYMIKSFPEIVKKDSSLDLIYEFRDEVAFPDGTPITGYDYEFSLKVIKNPLTDCGPSRAGYEMIDAVTVDQKNPKKFTVHFNKVYYLAEQMASSMTILNAKVYDPKSLLKEFSVSDLHFKSKELENNAKLKEQAEMFNTKFNNSIPENAGSGPYQFESLKAFERVILKKNKNWWGNKLKDANARIFHAYPDKLVYETVSDFQGAVVSLKAGKLDVLYGIPHLDFAEKMQKDEKIKSNFYLLTPPQFGFEHIGINIRNEKLSDVRVRKALSQLVDADKIINTVCYGMAQRTIGFMHPLKKEYYNEKLALYQYNVAEAKKLLTEAGWRDSDGDGVLDKVINGEKENLEINLFYNKGNDRRKKIAIYFQESAKAAGVKINVVVKDFPVLLDLLKSRNFDMYVLTTISSPHEFEYRGSWHSSGIKEGGNYTGFYNKRVDELFDKIQLCFDKNERAAYYKEIQAILHEECPVIPLMVHTERVAISKRFTNVEASGMFPGFDATMFKIQ